MNYREYGSNQKDTIVLLHGGGLSWWNYREAAEILQTDYRVILPILDGHAGSDRPFTSIEENAAEIVSFIDEHCGGSVLMIGGLSLGAQILLEVLSKRQNICTYAIVESASLIPSRLTTTLLGPVFGSSYGLIQNRRFAKLQFWSLHIKSELFEDYYKDTSLLQKSDMIAFMRASTSFKPKDTLYRSMAEVHVYYGSRETHIIRQSAQFLHKMLPASKVHCLYDFYHGEFSLNHAGKYTDTIRQIIGRR